MTNKETYIINILIHISLIVTPMIVMFYASTTMDTIKYGFVYIASVLLDINRRDTKHD